MDDVKLILMKKIKLWIKQQHRPNNFRNHSYAGGHHCLSYVPFRAEVRCARRAPQASPCARLSCLLHQSLSVKSNVPLLLFSHTKFWWRLCTKPGLPVCVCWLGSSPAGIPPWLCWAAPGCRWAAAPRHRWSSVVPLSQASLSWHVLLLASRSLGTVSERDSCSTQTRKSSWNMFFQGRASTE